MSCDDCQIDAQDAEQRRVLRILFSINAAMFVGEFVVGIAAESSGVLADSLDMLADALVYGISLFAVGRAASRKVTAARWSGYFQIAIAFGMMTDILRRVFLGSEPVSVWMMVISSVALVANIYCLRQISRHRDGGVHMRASWVFSRNDVIANIGVIAAAILITLTGSRWPDLIIGLLITAVVLRGGFTILREAAAEPQTTQS